MLDFQVICLALFIVIAVLVIKYANGDDVLAGNNSYTQDRQALHAYLSEPAHTAWQLFAEENGVSVTGLLEALGMELASELGDIDPDALRQDWVRAGRKIDAQRRRRGR